MHFFFFFFFKFLKKKKKKSACARARSSALARETRYFFLNCMVFFLLLSRNSMHITRGLSLYSHKIKSDAHLKKWAESPVNLNQCPLQADMSLFFQWIEMWEFNEHIISRVGIIQDITIHERYSYKEVGRIMGAFEPRHPRSRYILFFSIAWIFFVIEWENGPHEG